MTKDKYIPMLKIIEKEDGKVDFKPISSIPVEWIESWLKAMPKHTSPYFYKRFLRNAIRAMIEDYLKGKTYE